MKKFAADNLLFLRKAYPSIYRLVRNRFADQTRIVPDVARNGQPIAAIREDDQDTWLYSRYNPELEALRWVESLRGEAEQRENLLLFGFGLGYHAAAILKTFPDKKLFIYEPDLDIFLTAIERIDLRPILEHQQVAMFAIGEDVGIHEQMVSDILSHANGSFNFLAPPIYRKWHAQLLQTFTERGRNTALTYLANENTFRGFRKEWLENLFVNLERNMYTRSFHGLLNSCMGIPAVITGSGPSLGMELDHLKALRDRVLLIAAGSSIQPLLHNGIEPDLIVSIDAGKANQRVFEKFDISHIPFLYVPMIKHSAIRDAQSPFLLHAYFKADVLADDLVKWEEEDVIFESSATVAGTAIQAAVWLGCRDIVLIGHDFSYPGDKFYTPDVSHLSKQWQENRLKAETDLFVPNVKGGQNRTGKSMLVLKRNTETIMAGFPETRFYNASPVGAVIEHTSCMSLRELPDRLSPAPQSADWFKVLVKDRAKPISSERKDKFYTRLNRYVGELADWIIRFNGLEKMIQSVAELSGISNKHKLHAWFDQFEQSWGTLLEDHIFVTTFRPFLESEYHHALRYWPEMLQADSEDRKLRLLLVGIIPLINAIRELIPVCEKSLQYWQENRV